MKNKVVWQLVIREVLNNSTAESVLTDDGSPAFARRQAAAATCRRMGPLWWNTLPFLCKESLTLFYSVFHIAQLIHFLIRKVVHHDVFVQLF